jgi:hypothetical protein
VFTLTHKQHGNVIVADVEKFAVEYKTSSHEIVEVLMGLKNEHAGWTLPKKMKPSMKHTYKAASLITGQVD